MMNIGIIGLGVVGSAAKFGFEKKRGHNVFGYDKKDAATSLQNVFDHSEIIFVTVGTPMGPNGKCDISAVENVCRELNKLAANSGAKKDVVIKSTVEPGTTDRFAKELTHLRFAFNPEFLKEKAAIHDFCHQDICVIGTLHDDLYQKIVDIHGNLAEEYIRTIPLHAEFIKYYLNVFNATRIIFANLFYDLAKKLGADYQEIKSIAVKRHNMIDYYLDCNEKLRGFGGACLPKDTLAIQALATELGIDYSFLRGMIADNDRLNREYPNAS